MPRKSQSEKPQECTGWETGTVRDELSVLCQQRFTCTAPTKRAADAEATRLARDYVVADFQQQGASRLYYQNCYLKEIARLTAKLDAITAGRQYSHGAGTVSGVWPHPDDRSCNPWQVMGMCTPIYAWGFGGTSAEANYVRYQTIATHLALHIKRCTDDKKRATLQEAAKYLTGFIAQQYQVFAQEQATWQDAQQTLNDMLHPDAAWNAAPQAAQTEVLDSQTAA